jgi:hypothetical protein
MKMDEKKETLVIITEPGNITDYFRTKLEATGAVVLLAQDINKVKVLGKEDTADLHEMLYLALASIRTSEHAAQQFGKKLCDKFYHESGYYDWSKGRAGQS